MVRSRYRNYKRGRKRYKRYKRMFKRKFNRRRRRTPIGGFPKTKITKLRYVSAIQMGIEQGQQRSIRRWRANGIYDPDVNIGGHQPMNRDIYAAVYNRYCVLGAKITLKYMLHNGGANTTEPLVVGVLVNDDILETSTVSVNEMIENGRLTYKVEALNSASTSGTPKRITKYFSTKKFFGVKDVTDNTRLTSSINADPVTKAYLEVFVSKVESTSSTAVAITGVVEIDYIVKWMNKKDQATN